MKIKKSSGFNKQSFKILVNSESKSFWFRNRNYLILYYLNKYFPNMKNYLEIGCGTGYVLSAVKQKFPNCSINGSELYEEGLKYAKTRVPDANLIQLDAVKMEEKNIYDVFGAYDVLEHIFDDEKVIENLYQSLINYNDGFVRGGIITVPQHMFMWSNTDDAAQHVRRYSQKELRSKLEKAGFKVVRITGFVSLLFPFMLFSRVVNKKKVNTVNELSIPNWLNCFFSLIMKIELVLIKIGVSFPFGGSILCVVRR